MKKLLKTAVGLLVVQLIWSLLPPESLWRMMGLIAAYFIALPVMLVGVAWFYYRKDVSNWYYEQTHGVRVAVSPVPAVLLGMVICGVMLMPALHPAEQEAVAVAKPKSSPLFPVVEYLPAEVLQFSDRPTLMPIPAWVAHNVRESSLDQFNPPVAAVFDEVPLQPMRADASAPIGNPPAGSPATPSNIRLVITPEK